MPPSRKPAAGSPRIHSWEDVTYRLTRSPFRYFSLLLGAVVLLSLVLFVSGHDLGLGVGGMERMIVYPMTLWLIALGGYLMATDDEKHAPV